MAEKKITLGFDAAGEITVSQEPNLAKDDWVSFIATGASIFTVIIDDASKFNTSKRVLMYEVYDGHSGDTPTTKPNNTVNNINVEYRLYGTTSSDVVGIDPAAPPKIIIVPHT
jgi:hypothetical protein